MDEFTDAADALDDVVTAFDAGPDVPGADDVGSSDPDEATLAVADNYSEPWNRYADETDRNWEYFRYHRDQGPARSIKESAAHFGVTPASFWRLSAKFDWVDRLKAFDQHEDRIYQARRVTAIREMADRHAADIVGYLEALKLPFDALQRKLASDPEALDGFNAKQLVDMSTKVGRIIPSMMNAERLARGMPSEVIEIHGEVTHTHELDRDQLGEVLETLIAAGAFVPGADGEAESFIEAEVVEVHPEGGSDVRPEP